MEPQPGFFPFLGGVILLIFSIIIFFQGWGGQKQRKVAFGEIRRPALLLAVLVLLVAVLDHLGYVIGTFLASVLILRILQVKSWRALILTGLGDLYTEIEEFEAASQAYEQAESIIPSLSGFFITNYLPLARANMALLEGNSDAALEILRSFQKHLKVNPSAYERGLWSLLQGRTHLLKHETKKAISFLSAG